MVPGEGKAGKEKQISLQTSPRGSALCMANHQMPLNWNRRCNKNPAAAENTSPDLNMEISTAKISKPSKLSPGILHIEHLCGMDELSQSSMAALIPVCFAPPVVLKQRISINVHLIKLEETSVGLNKTSFNFGLFFLWTTGCFC